MTLESGDIMNDIKKRIFLNWLMYFIIFFCFGWISLFCWTVYQILKYNQDIKEENKRHIPIRERDCVIEINKKENLTNKEVITLKRNPKMIKVGNIGESTVYVYDKKVKHR